MSEEEVLKKMRQLLYKIRRTKNKKLKRLYLFDFVTLVQFLEISYNREITPDELLCDDIACDVEELMECNTIESLNDFIGGNATTQRLANSCILTFENLGFDAYYNQSFPVYKTSFLTESLTEFLDTVGNKSLENYNKVLEQGIIIGEIGSSISGACFNLYCDNKQLVNMSSLHYKYGKSVSEIGFFASLAHEIGHVVHLNLINKSVKNKEYTNVFTESISMMYEKMYLDFLKKNNVDITPDLRNEYYSLLYNSIIARAGSLAIDDGILCTDYSIPGMYFTEDYFGSYDYLLSQFTYEMYDDLLPYFYGELIATKYMDDFGSDYKSCTKELLEVLMQNESKDSFKLLDEIGFYNVPKGVANGIRNVNNAKKKVKL